MADAAERDELPPILEYLEGVIPDRGYLVDGRLTLADLSVASPLANLSYCGVTIDPARYPKVTRFLALILGRPSFAPHLEREAAFLERQPA